MNKGAQIGVEELEGIAVGYSAYLLCTTWTASRVKAAYKDSTPEVQIERLYLMLFNTT